MKRIFSIKSLAVELELAEQTIRQYVTAKRIPYHKLDRRIRFLYSEIKQWVKNDMKMPLPDKNENAGGEK